MSGADGLLVATGGLQAAGHIIQGEAGRRAHKYNEQVARQNAVIARQQAAADEGAQRRSAARQIGNMRASFGASGVQMEGSALDVLASSMAEAEMDALNIRYGGAMRARGYEIEASQQRRAARMARTQGILGAVGAGTQTAADYRAMQARM